ncbi:hypothetical protein Clacol_008617 [Clathrus columnatus]|uniref:Uncharacterized protein n=1 Tax=Clathrus columnatus TaxID=1419009 RepID=A0AAV5ANV1_9AGAM|nr:hypothetical protein Clacol_008617 [Clathrus columnatus]
MFRFIREQIATWHENWGISGVYLVFIRDGVWAYVVLFVMFLGSAVEHNFSGTPWIVGTTLHYSSLR